MNTHPYTHVLAAGLLLSLLASAVHAATSASTTTVKGRAPVVSTPQITNMTSPSIPAGVMKVGDVGKVAYTFTDADNDMDSGTSFQWQVGGTNISGSTSGTYEPGIIDTNSDVWVLVTPKTNVAITDPAVGVTIKSQVKQVVYLDTAKWSTPDGITRNNADAKTYCASIGARLPTISELTNLFIQATISKSAPSTINGNLCDIYGWPLAGKCAGIVSNYWSADPGTTGNFKSIMMDRGAEGSSGANSLFSVSCVR